MLNPQIIYEDDDLIVVDKPAGIIVNRADTTAGVETLQDWVEKQYQISNIKYQISNENGRGPRAGDLEEEFLSRGGIVHRLDKETSGILLVAKNPQSFERLKTQFKEREVKKTYIALVHGKVAPTRGEINVPVGRLPWNRKRFGVLAEGREATTRYSTISNYTLDARLDSFSARQAIPYTLLEVSPKTGRTHQIRVHLKYIGHPIFSDPLYAGRKVSREDRRNLTRIFLHASRISFRHPTSGEELEFKSELPAELGDFLKTLKSKSD